MLKNKVTTGVNKQMEGHLHNPPTPPPNKKKWEKQETIHKKFQA